MCVCVWGGGGGGGEGVRASVWVQDSTGLGDLATRPSTSTMDSRGIRDAYFTMPCAPPRPADTPVPPGDRSPQRHADVLGGSLYHASVGTCSPGTTAPTA